MSSGDERIEEYEEGKIAIDCEYDAYDCMVCVCACVVYV